VTILILVLRQWFRSRGATFLLPKLVVALSLAWVTQLCDSLYSLACSMWWAKKWNSWYSSLSSC